jgi:acetoin utilization deacetylase AcuC-like enzyme
LHEEDYAWITQKVKAIADEVCHGRIVSTLEGGYALDVLGLAAVAHIEALSIP